MKEDLDNRFIKPKRTWGQRLTKTHVVFNNVVIATLDERARQLTEALGREVNRTMVINDLIAQDKTLQAIQRIIEKD